MLCGWNLSFPLPSNKCIPPFTLQSTIVLKKYLIPITGIYSIISIPMHTPIYQRINKIANKLFFILFIINSICLWILSFLFVSASKTQMRDFYLASSPPPRESYLDLGVSLIIYYLLLYWAMGDLRYVNLNTHKMGNTSNK